MPAAALVLYALGAMLMRARMAALVDDVQLSDVPAATPSPATVALVVVLLWPLVVLLYTCLAWMLLRPRPGRRPERRRTPRAGGAVGRAAAISSVAALTPPLEDP